MGTVVKVVLAMLLVLVLLVVLGLLYLRWKLLRAFGDLAEALEASAEGMSPAEVHLAPESQPDWSDAPAVTAAQADLEAAGFAVIGAYTVDAMAGLTMMGLVNVAESAWAVIYEYPGVGVWLDVVTRYTDGGGLTATNSPHVGNLDPMPGKDRAVEVGASVPRVIELWSAAVRADGRKPATADNFVAEFEAAYAEEMAWRDQRGGPTEEEVRRIAAQMGDDEVSEEAIAATTQIQGMHAALREADRAARPGRDAQTDDWPMPPDDEDDE